MESNEEIQERMRLADRAAAAPYVDYPRDPWWVAPGFGVLAALFVVGVRLEDWAGVSGWVSAMLMLLVVAGSFGYLRWQTRRRGTFPTGSMPPELKRVFIGYVVGAIVVGVAVFLLADLAPWWLAISGAFLLALAGMWWFGRRYDHAAAKVRKRLA